MTLLVGKHHSIHAWKGNLPVNSRYTYGIAGERFFRTIKDEGRILGSKCNKCQNTYVPATTFCEKCLGELTEWVDVGTVGEVYTFTLLNVAIDGNIHETPEVIAFIKLGDGGLIHRLGELEPQSVLIGMQVQAVFKDNEDRVGSILDIQYFKPV